MEIKDKKRRADGWWGQTEAEGSEVCDRSVKAIAAGRLATATATATALQCIIHFMLQLQCYWIVLQCSSLQLRCTSKLHCADL